MADSSLFMLGADREYRRSRDRLRAAEIDLRDRIEAVAAMRRALPPGPLVPDYAFFEDGNRIRLSELFAADKPYLIVYHLMYWAKDDSFCPSCSMWIDGFDAVAPHLAQQTNFVVATRAPLERLREWADHRGWHRVRLLSDDGPGFARNVGAEDAEGNPDSTVAVFAKEGDRVRHTYTAHPILDDRQRGIDLLTPAYNVLDLTPGGRGDWSPSNEGFDAAMNALGQRVARRDQALA
jgi:predicted dithiol-disulfide oxidoreductase (DUF899 family)